MLLLQANHPKPASNYLLIKSVPLNPTVHAPLRVFGMHYTDDRRLKHTVGLTDFVYAVWNVNQIGGKAYNNYFCVFLGDSLYNSLSADENYAHLCIF